MITDDLSPDWHDVPPRDQVKPGFVPGVETSAQPDTAWLSVRLAYGQLPVAMLIRGVAA